MPNFIAPSPLGLGRLAVLERIESGELRGAVGRRQELCPDRLARLGAAVIYRRHRVPVDHAVPDRVDERFARHTLALLAAKGEAAEFRDGGLQIGDMNRLVLADALDKVGGMLGRGAAIGEYVGRSHDADAEAEEGLGAD